jgi:hypothetical protein
MNSQTDSLRDWNRKRFSAIYESFEGAEAIYAECPVILHVRVSQVSFDDWGVRAILTDLLSPGMHRVHRNPLKIGSAWEIFSFNEGNWDTPNIPQSRHRLFFHPSVVRPTVELGARVNRQEAVIDWDEFLVIVRPYYDAKSKELAERLEQKLKLSGGGPSGAA